MNITELVIRLPDEIKKIILDKLPIEYLLEKNSIKISYIIDEYINEYINKKILYDMSKSGYIHNTILYKHLTRDTVNNLSLSYARKFMYYTNMHSGGVVKINDYMNKHFNKILFIITFKFTKVGNFYSSSTDDSTFTISNDGWNDETKCSKVYYNTSLFIEYNEESIKSSIYNVLLRQMDNSDTVEDIKSMRIMKISYPEGIKNYNKFTEEVLYNII